ncbi:hypothetical protein ACFWZU_13385 [Frateuria sp. GZRR33]|uniref:hypothetical protein n=1 Tax=Frateuria sp. GZRR33 TaxID=3351535 RepID=UPI003EDC12B3
MPTPLARLKPSWIARTNLSGAIAAVLSSVVVAACSACEARAPLAGVNAPSQWLWGRRAKRHVGPSWRYTAVGYAVHHFSSLWWAGIYEAWCLRWPAPPRVSAARAAAVATAACVVDYTITPPRFRPGFERHIGRASIAAVYVAFGVGLFAGAWARRRYVR